MTELQENSASWPFRESVDLSKYPAYLNFVKKPMGNNFPQEIRILDLSTVHKKLTQKEYKLIKEFADDVYQIFENARIFNEKGSPIRQCAELMEKQFRKSLNIVKEELSTNTNHQPNYDVGI